MEWSVRKELLNRLWNSLAPGDDARVKDEALAWPFLSRPWAHVTVLLAIALVFYLVRLGTKVLEGDEATYALLSKTIVLSGDWTHLTLNGEPYLRKPPLYFWLTALAFQLFSISPFSASLVSALFGVADTLLVYAVCRAMFPGWVMAFVSALVYLTTHEALHWSRGVHLETLVTFWLLLGLLAVQRSVRSPGAMVLLGLSLAGGWLGKGVQGLYPAAVALCVWVRERILVHRVASVWILALIGPLSAAVGAWVWAGGEQIERFGEAYMVEQIGYKFFGPPMIHNSAFFYLGKLLETYWPWLPAAVIGAIMLARSWRDSLGARVWLIYGAVVMAAILFAAERRSRYLFQLYPALSVAAGVALTRAMKTRPRLLSWFLAVVILGGAVIASFGGRHFPLSEKTQETLLVASRIRLENRVLLTQAAQYGRPTVGAILGFYARPLLRTCKDLCKEEAAPGSTVIARFDEAAQVANLLNGRIDYHNQTLAIVKIPTLSSYH